MKTCAICGQVAERGSMCRDCRSALKRARDETVSQFQPAPSLAMALPGMGAEPATAAVAPAAGRQRAETPEKRPAARRGTSARPARPAPAPEEMPGRSNASRFVWVIVTLMVLVVSYVAYGVIRAGIEAAKGADPPAAMKEPASVRPAPAPVPRRVETVVTPSLREAQLGFGAQDEVDRRMGAAPSAHDLPAATATATYSARSRESARAATSEVIQRNAARNSIPPVETRPEPSRVEPPAPMPVVVAAAPSRAAETPRRDRWERMDAALRSCRAEEFLSRVICEQKVRLDYCEGLWGQAAQCPGGPANDHGQ